MLKCRETLCDQGICDALPFASIVANIMTMESAVCMV